MTQGEELKRQEIRSQLKGMLRDLDELARLFQLYEEEVAVNLDFPGRTRLLEFFRKEEPSIIADWKAQVAELVANGELLFSSQALNWIGRIRGLSKALDVNFSLSRHSVNLEQVAGRIVLSAVQLYR